MESPRWSQAFRWSREGLKSWEISKTGGYFCETTEQPPWQWGFITSGEVFQEPCNETKPASKALCLKNERIPRQRARSAEAQLPQAPLEYPKPQGSSPGEHSQLPSAKEIPNGAFFFPFFSCRRVQASRIRPPIPAFGRTHPTKSCSPRVPTTRAAKKTRGNFMVSGCGRASALKGIDRAPI